MLMPALFQPEWQAQPVSGYWRDNRSQRFCRRWRGGCRLQNRADGNAAAEMTLSAGVGAPSPRPMIVTRLRLGLWSPPTSAVLKCSGTLCVSAWGLGSRAPKPTPSYCFSPFFPHLRGTPIQTYLLARAASR